MSLISKTLICGCLNFYNVCSSAQQSEAHCSHPWMIPCKGLPAPVSWPVCSDWGRWRGATKRAWQQPSSVGPPPWSMLSWNHTADSRQWTTHSANRPCVLHNTKEEDSGYNAACCSWTGVSAGKRRGLRPPVYWSAWAVKRHWLQDQLKWCF